MNYIQKALLVTFEGIGWHGRGKMVMVMNDERIPRIPVWPVVSSYTHHGRSMTGWWKVGGKLLQHYFISFGYLFSAIIPLHTYFHYFVYFFFSHPKFLL